MARTSRKVNPVLPVEAIEGQNTVTAYRTAGYIRLSIEDSGRPGSDTLESQRKLVTDYIAEQPDMVLSQFYCDNGRTGTNFDRPQFDLLMDAVRRGEINCIVVKDLSRFGRNYKETGNYLERIFPFLGVRFVAVNDNFDTLTAERNEYGFIVPLKNLMNETYSRDISKKQSSALEAKQRRGEFVGVYAPYGYSKSEANRHKLVVNPDTAPIVRTIFALRLGGMGYTGIARKLNADGVLSPGAYLYHTGQSERTTYQNALWAAWNIKEILNNEVYLGHLIQGKRTNEAYKKPRKARYAPESEWRICRDTHEALVDEATFSACQAMAVESRTKYHAMIGRNPVKKTANLFLGLIYCADCGKALSRRQVYSNWHSGKRVYYYNFFCLTTVKKSGACTPKNLMEQELLKVVTDSIHCYIDAIAELEIRIKRIWTEKTAAQSREAAAEIAAAQREVSRYQTLLDGLYPNVVDGLISRQEYHAMKERYQAILEENAAHLEALKSRQIEQGRYSAENPLFTLKRALREGESLTAELIHALISRIDVGDDDHITIRFNYQDEFEALTEYAKEAEAE